MITFWVTFHVTLCFHYFCNFQKKGPRLKWTICKHVSDKSKKCLSVGNFGILSVEVCNAFTTYFSLCSGLKYLDVTEIYGRPFDLIEFLWVFSYIIIDHACLKCCISTKFSQLVYLIKTNMPKCQI